MKVRDTICNECPFRRCAAAGWLGSNTPQDFVQLALDDESVACHLMVDQTLPRAKWEKAEESTVRCRGALTLTRNSAKLPRDREMAILVKSVPADRDAVFSNSREFIQHHEAAKVKSWEFE
jgi:hypothetical protein